MSESANPSTGACIPTFDAERINMAGMNGPRRSGRLSLKDRIGAV